MKPIYRLFTFAVILLIASASFAQDLYLVRASTEPNGMVGYKDTNGRWVLPPCADRLPLDSVYLVNGKDYRFVASLKGKQGVVDMNGNWTVEPRYEQLAMLNPNRPYFPDGGFLNASNALPTDHIQAVVAKGENKKGINYEMYLLDVETGIKIMSQPFYATKMPNYRLVDVNPDSKLIVLDKNYYTDSSIDSIRVVDFDGNEIIQPYYSPLPGEIYYTKGKKTDMVPYFTCAVDGQPVIAYLKSKGDLSMVKKYTHKLPNDSPFDYKIILMDIKGNQLPFKPLDKNWQVSGDYRFDPAPVAKALEKIKDAESLYAQISDAYSAFEFRKNNMLAERQVAPKSEEKDWVIASACQDSLFSIIRQDDRYGILASGAKVTIPCIYNKITEIEYFPGVFLIENEYGKGLSDGFSVTAPTGFERFVKRDDGILELSVKSGKFSYSEYADSSGMIFANNLEDVFEIAFPDDIDPKSRNIYDFSLIGVKLGRRNIYPLARLNFAVKLENAGYYEEAYREYEWALDYDSRLTFAKERMDDLRPVVEQIRRDRVAAIKAERRARAEQVSAALSQFAVAFDQMAQSINNLSHRRSVSPKTKTNVQRPTNQGSASTSNSYRKESTTKKDKKATPTADDIMHRNNQRKVYNEWENRLECMKNHWYPYAKGDYSQSDVTYAQSKMREIRQLWESRDLWPYGVSPMETWSGR